jgi:membrane protease YdiL (CAAX protease family)
MNTHKTGSGFPWLFFVLAFAWTWSFWVPTALSENGIIQIPARLAWILADGKPAAWGPLLAAIVVGFIQSGRAGVVGILSSMMRFKFGWIWYVAALAILPLIVGSATLIAWLSGEALPLSEALENPVGIPIAFVWIFFFGGPLQEEAGWRGTATSSMQGKIGALAASLVTGLFWGLWHLPLFFMPRKDIYYNQLVWGLIGSTVLLSVLLSWVYNNTSRSPFAVMLMHTTYNWANFLFTGLNTDTGGLAYFLLLASTVAAVVAVFGAKTLVRAR